MGAQQPVPVERGQRPRRRRPPAAASAYGERGGARPSERSTAAGSSVSHELDLVGAGAQHREHARRRRPPRSASASCRSRAPKRWVVGERGDRDVGRAARSRRPGRRAPRRRSTEVELVGVADQHQPRLGPHRLEQPGHHRQRHHRGLVDDDHVVREPVAAVVAEPGAVVGAPAEQPVQGHRRRRRPTRVVGPRRKRPAAVAHGLLQPGRGLAGRRGERDRERSRRGPRPARRAAPAAGDRGGLAGAGSAGEHRGPLRAAARDGGALLVVTSAPAKTRASGCVEQRPRRPPAPAGVAVREVVADLALLPLVAVEVEQAVLRAARTPGVEQRAGGDGGHPRVGSGHGRSRSGATSGDRGEVEAHRAVAYGADGQRHREQHPLVGLARERARARARRGRRPPSARRRR